MFGWLGAYLERRRRRKARAAKMAADSAQMAAMLQSNASPRSRRRKGFWAKLFGTGQRTSMPLPPPAAPPGLDASHLQYRGLVLLPFVRDDGPEP